MGRNSGVLSSPRGYLLLEATKGKFASLKIKFDSAFEVLKLYWSNGL